MHRDKTVARIILILSVVHLAIAAPATVRQRYQDVDEDMTPASEKRGNPGDTPQDLSPVPQMDNGLPTTSGTPVSQDDPLPESGTPQLHNGHPQASGLPSSQDDTPPASEDPQFRNDPAGSEDPQLHDAPSPSNSDWRPTDEIVPAESSAQLESGAPGASVHLLESGKSDHALGQWPTDFPAGEGTPSMDGRLSLWSDSLPSWLPEEEAPPAPEAKQAFSDVMKHHLKVLAGMSAVAGVYVGLVYGFNKLINGHSHAAQPAGRDLTSSDSDVVGRGVSTLPRAPQKPVSRTRGNEDLGLLSVLTRRALERLD